MAEISKITLPSGTTYDLKDAHARELIDEMSGYTDFLGVTTTALSDGATTNPIKINNADVTAKKGNIATYGSGEFIFNGTAWQAFGDLSGLGSLAYKNSATGSTTVAVPKTYTTTIAPKAKNVSVSGTTTGSVSVTKSDVAVGQATSGTATYTPAGTNASSSVSGSCTVTPSGSVSTTYNATSSGASGNFTPAGTVSTPTITVTPSTTSKFVASSSTGGGSVTAGSAASFTATVASGSETLTLGWTANKPTAVTLPSFSSQTIATGISSATSTQPTFTGTKVYAHHSFSGSSSSGTISGTAAAQTFTGTGARLLTMDQVATDASFVGASMTSTGSYTPAVPDATTTTATTENKTVTITAS